MIEGEDWARLDTLLQEALDRPPEDRPRWLEETCGGDAALREKLEELIRLAEDPSEDWRPGAALANDPGDGILVPGQQLGRYQVLDLLGAGGMGHVYLAIDPSLGREVAIKALAHAFRGDSGSLRRFEREARVLATLSHPNVATIYGFERLDGAPYLILERVEGETLSQRLRRGPLSLRETVAVALQVAEGLEEAHGKGVIHRDLKPSNVMLEPGGRVKLVDFGLAKTGGKTDPASSKEPSTASSLEPTTASGAILGTAPYMSPEQIHGDEVDTRTDIWAFGCLLYEMLTGQPAFPGRSLPALLAAVLRDDPNWSALPPDLPASLRRLLRRCLRKDPRARLQHIGDARVELTDLEPEPAPPARPTTSPRERRALPWLVAAVSLVAAGAVFLWRWPLRVAAPHTLRLSLELPAGVTLGTEFAPPFAVAPSGALIALEGVEGETTRLYVRSLDDVTLRPLPGTEDARQPFFSPDGRWVAFFADRKLKKVPVDGGPVVPVADIGRNPRGATWTADGTIVLAMSQTSGLVRIPESGGRPATLTTVDASRGEASHRWPEALPGGKWVIFTVGLEDAGFDEARLEAVSLETGQRRAVLADAAFGRYLPAGSLMFVRSGRVHAVAFDPERLETRGAPEVVLDAVRFDPRNGACHLAVSPSGVLVYGPGVASSSDRYLAWIDLDGRLERVVDTPRPFRDTRLSPDGQRVAVTIGPSTESDLWLLDANATLSRLTFGLSPHRPSWMPDGKRVSVGAQKDGAWRLVTLPVEGGGEPAVLLEGPHRMYPNTWSPDGRHLVFQEYRPETGWDLLTLQVDALGRAVGQPQTLTATPFEESGAVISPDGGWVAYESDEVDALVQVYVRSFPDGGNKVRASTAGSRGPAWGRGGELYFWETSQQRPLVAHTRRDGSRLLVDAGQPIWAGPRPAAIARAIIGGGWSRFEVHPSGRRFLMLETAAPSLEPSLSRPLIVLGGAEGLRAHTPPPQ